jgi:hypothetical protein
VNEFDGETPINPEPSSTPSEKLYRSLKSCAVNVGKVPAGAPFRVTLQVDTNAGLAKQELEAPPEVSWI